MYKQPTMVPGLQATTRLQRSLKTLENGQPVRNGQARKPTSLREENV
jgi:hypothetical protein